MGFSAASVSRQAFHQRTCWENSGLDPRQGLFSHEHKFLASRILPFDQRERPTQFFPQFGVCLVDWVSSVFSLSSLSLLSLTLGPTLLPSKSRLAIRRESLEDRFSELHRPSFCAKERRETFYNDDTDLPLVSPVSRWLQLFLSVFQRRKNSSSCLALCVALFWTEKYFLAKGNRSALFRVVALIIINIMRATLVGEKMMFIIILCTVSHVHVVAKYQFHDSLFLTLPL